MWESWKSSNKALDLIGFDTVVAENFDSQLAQFLSMDCILRRVSPASKRSICESLKPRRHYR